MKIEIKDQSARVTIQGIEYVIDEHKGEMRIIAISRISNISISPITGNSIKITAS